MRQRIRQVALACACAAVVGAAVPPAMAASGNAVINDCESNGQLTHPYSLQQLQHALAVMPASVKQYTNCYDVIETGLLRAKHKRTGGAGGTGSSSGGFLPTPVIV